MRHPRLEELSSRRQATITQIHLSCHLLKRLRQMVHQITEEEVENQHSSRHHNNLIATVRTAAVVAISFSHPIAPNSIPTRSSCRPTTTATPRRRRATRVSKQAQQCSRISAAVRRVRPRWARTTAAPTCPSPPPLISQPQQLVVCTTIISTIITSRHKIKSHLDSVVYHI